MDAPRAAEGAGGRSELWPSLVVFLLAALGFGLYGNQGRLNHDDAIYFYGGQEVLRGVPPYVGIFEHKAPLSQLSCAVGVGVARLLGTDDLLTTRWMSLFSAAGTLALLYRLSVRLFGSRAQGLVSAAAMLACWGYGIFAFSATQPKLLVILFEVGCLLATVERRWLWAGLWGGLAGWTWQPLALFGLAAVGVAAVQEERGRRLPAAGRVLAGLLVPSVGLVAYYAYHGALRDMLDGALLFNVRYLQIPTTPLEHLFIMYKAVVFVKMGFSIVLGLFMLLLLYPWRYRRAGGLRALARDRFLIVLVTFPLPFAWSLVDFQGYPDFFVFLPYALLGYGWLVGAGVGQAADVIGLRGLTREALVAAPAALLWTVSSLAYHLFHESALQRQRDDARALVEAYGADARLLAIGHPELLVLLHRRNPTRFAFIMRGIREYIDDHEPGGFAGWLRSLDESGADVIVLDEDYAAQLGPFRPAWEAWVAGLERRERFGRWQVFVPAEGAPGAPDAQSSPPPK